LKKIKKLVAATFNYRDKQKKKLFLVEIVRRIYDCLLVKRRRKFFPRILRKNTKEKSKTLVSSFVFVVSANHLVKLSIDNYRNVVFFIHE
jgi:hypothetical protein